MNEMESNSPLPSAGEDLPLGGMASDPVPTAIGPETGGRRDVPELVRDAGEGAVAAYLAFVNQPDWSGATCNLYRQQAGRFFRWAASRGLALESIRPAEVSAYAAELGASMSPRSTATYLTGVRAAFRHLVGAGVLPENPCDAPLDAARRTAKDWSTKEAVGTSEASAAGFPLLDLLTMLGNMEEQTLLRIFAEEAVALWLLERVRWPEGSACPYCGAEAGGEPRAEVVCPACAKPYTVTTGTMFEGSPVPVRHWFFLIHQMYLAESGLPNDDLQQRMGIDLAAIASLCRRIAEAVTQEGLPAGDVLKRAIVVRNKELIQDDVARAIIAYAGLEAVRDRLMQARDEGKTVEDLPEGMTLEEALEKIEARIAEEDSYVITMEDGYLVRSAVETAAGGEDAGGNP
jgi:transposase-like protein